MYSGFAQQIFWFLKEEEIFLLLFNLTQGIHVLQRAHIQGTPFTCRSTNSATDHIVACHSDTGVVHSIILKQEGKKSLKY